MQTSLSKYFALDYVPYSVMALHLYPIFLYIVSISVLSTNPLSEIQESKYSSLISLKNLNWPLYLYSQVSGKRVSNFQDLHVSPIHRIPILRLLYCLDELAALLNQVCPEVCNTKSVKRLAETLYIICSSNRTKGI